MNYAKCEFVIILNNHVSCSVITWYVCDVMMMSLHEYMSLRCRLDGQLCAIKRMCWLM